MKKYLLLISLVLFSMQSCTNDTIEEVETLKLGTSTYFSPVSWIQGTWKIAPFGTPIDSDLTMRFTNDDIISISSGGTETSWTQKFYNTSYNEEVTESKSELSYTLEIKTSAGIEKWEFRKISNNELECRTAPVLNWTKLVKI